MNKGLNLLQRLADSADLPDEAIPAVPVIEIAGDRRVWIEHHQGVTGYTREKICVRVRYGQIEVCGCGLELSRMTKEHLLICGRIDGVMLVRRA